MAVPVEAAVRKKVLRVVFISLLLDLVSWQFFSPLDFSKPMVECRQWLTMLNIGLIYIYPTTLSLPPRILQIPRSTGGVLVFAEITICAGAHPLIPKCL
jgi:hypothetical protein